MEKQFGLIIFVGAFIGAALGLAFGAASGDPLLALGIGTLGGVFIGWFAAAAVQQGQKE